MDWPAYPFSLFSIPLLPPALCIILIGFHLQVCSLFLLPVFCTCYPLIVERWAVNSSGKPSMTSNTWIKYSFLSVPFLCTLESLISQSNCCTALEFVVYFSVTVSSARAVTMSLYFSLLSPASDGSLSPSLLSLLTFTEHLLRVLRPL